MVTVSMGFIIAVAVVCYWVGIFTHSVINKTANAGTLLIDENSGKVVFQFSVMPEDLISAKTIHMKVKKCEIRDSDNYNSDNDETN